MVLIRENKYLAVAFAVLMLSFTACGIKVKYSMGGAIIDPQVKTVSVQYFQNRASLVQPTLSQDITDALIDKCKAQTNLKIVTSAGDVSFEGSIVDYKSVPFTSTSTEQGAMNRFTISVKVKFVNSVDPDQSFEQTFSRSKDYTSNLDLSSVEADLSEEIVGEIVEDIFNKAFVNW